MTELGCLSCKMSEPMTELAAIDAVKQQDAVNPGLLGYFPCPLGDGYHLCLAEARVPVHFDDEPDEIA